MGNSSESTAVLARDAIVAVAERLLFIEHFASYGPNPCRSDQLAKRNNDDVSGLVAYVRPPRCSTSHKALDLATLPCVNNGCGP